VIWGGVEPEFESEAEMRMVLRTIMGRYNEIAARLHANSAEFDPIFLEGPEGEVIASDWAGGFLDAVALRPRAWEPLIRRHRGRIMMMPLLVLNGDAEPDVGRVLEEPPWQSEAAIEPRSQQTRRPQTPMTKQSVSATSMVDQIGAAIAKADGSNFESDPARYRRLALAALKPLTKPTEAMVDAAHEAVWSDAFWAINSRADFKRAVRAMIRAAIDE
jgi:hypothetical protein